MEVVGGWGQAFGVAGGADMVGLDVDGAHAANPVGLLKYRECFRGNRLEFVR